MRKISSDRWLRRFYRRWERELQQIWPSPGWRMLAAVSGGCDSVVLAWLLSESARRGLGSLVLAHVNHRLRPEADEEEAFVRRLARGWRLPLHVSRVRPRRLAAERGWSLEQAARATRAEALAFICNSTGCDAVALGHQMDDQAETLLLRLLRGTGPRGLGAMAARSTLAPGPVGTATATATLLRPLLGFRRRELRAIARRVGLEWIEDPSNDDRTIVRNRIRHQLIPHLSRSYNPRLVESLAELAHRQRLESEPVEQQAAALKTRAVTSHASAPHAGHATLCVEADLVALADRPEAVVSRALWLAYQELTGPEGVLGGRHIEELLRLARTSAQGGDEPPADQPGEIHLPGRVRARREGERILFERHAPRPEAGSPAASGITEGRARRSSPTHLIPIDYAPQLAGTAELVLPVARQIVVGPWILESEQTSRPPVDLASPDLAVFDLDGLEPPLHARLWRAGDALVPFGMQGHKKVSDLLSERKLPRAQRARVHVVTDRNGILWVIGQRRSCRAPVTPETRSVLVLRARPRAEESP